MNIPIRFALAFLICNVAAGMAAAQLVLDMPGPPKSSAAPPAPGTTAANADPGVVALARYALGRRPARASLPASSIPLGRVYRGSPYDDGYTYGGSYPYIWTGGYYTGGYNGWWIGPSGYYGFGGWCGFGFPTWSFDFIFD